MVYRFIWCFLWEDKNLELSLWCLISVLPGGDESGGKLYKIMCCLEGQLWRGQRALLTCTFFQFIIILMPKLNILQWHILLPFIIYVVTGFTVNISPIPTPSQPRRDPCEHITICYWSVQNHIFWQLYLPGNLLPYQV